MVKAIELRMADSWRERQFSSTFCRLISSESSDALVEAFQIVDSDILNFSQIKISF
jgi:hypothetical protein